LQHICGGVSAGTPTFREVSHTAVEPRIGQGERVENIRKREDKSVFGGFAVSAKLLNFYSEWRSG
jgi:hypothetical protein